MLKNVFSLQVGQEAFKEAKSIVERLYPSVAQSDLEKCAESSDLNPALFSFLASRLSLEPRRSTKDVSKFCRKIISEKIAVEIWHEIAPSLAVMTRENRRFLWSLVHDGIQDDKFEKLDSGAWYKHLQPFAREYKSQKRPGCYWRVSSKPFQAFIESVLGKEGKLKVQPGHPFPGLSVLVASFNQRVCQFGETCNRLKDPNHTVVHEFLKWFVDALPTSLQDLKKFIDCDLIRHLLQECASVTSQKLKNSISQSGSLYMASFHMFIAARHCRCHVQMGEDNTVIYAHFPVDVNETIHRLN